MSVPGVLTTQSLPRRLVSVVIPTYNRADYLMEALDSVANQSWRPIEVVVVDDGSEDETIDLLRARAEAWGTSSGLGLRSIRQPRAGAAAARNRGWTEARGDYIQFLDSDDVLHPERFRRVVHAAESAGADLVFTGFEAFDALTGETLEVHPGKPGRDLVSLALRGRLWANTLRVTYHRSLLDRMAPWDEGMTCFEDREFVERALFQARRPTVLRHVLASARRGHHGRLSAAMSTHAGRACRVLCEERLAALARGAGTMDVEALSQFAARLYGLATRCNAMGWTDLAHRSAAAAQSVNAPLGWVGWRRRLAYLGGPRVARAYRRAHTVKSALRSGIAGKAAGRLPTWVKVGGRHRGQ